MASSRRGCPFRAAISVPSPAVGQVLAELTPGTVAPQLNPVGNGRQLAGPVRVLVQSFERVIIAPRKSKCCK